MDKDEEQRSHERKPIRLRVSYKSAHSLVTEYTTSISKGGCTIETRQPLEKGTRFTFELFAQGNELALEVEGRVVRSEPIPGGLHTVGIEYLPGGPNRTALDNALEVLFKEHQFEKERRHPRVPVNLVAADGLNTDLRYLVRDVSLGGAGLQLSRELTLPEFIRAKTPVLVEITLDDASRCAIEGQVVWTLPGRKGFSNPRAGIAFGPMTEQQEAIVQRVLHLHRPEQILLTFGD